MSRPVYDHNRSGGAAYKEACGFFCSYENHFSLSREVKRLREEGYDRNDLDRLARIVSDHRCAMTLAHDLAMEEDVRWESEKWDREYGLGYMYAEDPD